MPTCLDGRKIVFPSVPIFHGVPKEVGYLLYDTPGVRNPPRKKTMK